MNAAAEGHRPQLLEELRRFVRSARELPGMKSIDVLGSIITTKPRYREMISFARPYRYNLHRLALDPSSQCENKTRKSRPNSSDARKRSI